MSYLGTKENAKADQSSVEMKSDGGMATPANKAGQGELTTRRTTLKPAHSGSGVTRKEE